MATYSGERLPPGGNDDAELFWLAYCYVAGELSAAQALEFETRLESDQPAREAVAQAVELSAALQGASESMVELPSGDRRKSIRGGWALAMAASVALAIAGYSFIGRNAQNAALQPSQTDGRLADAWAASTLDDGEAETGDEANRLAEWEASGWDDGESEPSDGELLISDWLLEAVSAARALPAAESTHREG